MALCSASASIFSGTSEGKSKDADSAIEGEVDNGARRSSSSFKNVRTAGGLKAALAAQKERLYSLFELWDNDGNGLDVDEFRRAIKMLRLKPSQRDISDFIREADTDDSGTLDIKEIRHMIDQVTE